MSLNLQEKSVSYYKNAQIYDLFSQQEDAPGKIFKVLLPEIKDKTLLDLGCGSGKYTKLFSPHVKKVIAVDASQEQLLICKNKARKFDNIDYICANADHLDIKNDIVDVVLASWMLGTIKSDRRKKEVLARIIKTMKPGAKFFLVENDEGGEFELIRGRINDPGKRTKKYNDWLINNGFEVFEKFSTYFKFKDISETNMVIGSIWGNEAGKQVKSNKIEHKIKIFCFQKKLNY